MLLKINPQAPNPTKVNKAVSILRNGGIIVLPTDTVYSFACDIEHPRALDKISRLKNLKQKQANFSIICSDISQVSEYTKQFDRTTYKRLNNNLPGPYTFILEASKTVSRIFNFNKKEIGIRIPDNKITMAIVSALGQPIIVTSIHHDDNIREYITDPGEIFEQYKHEVDAVIDGGTGGNTPSTVIDLTNDAPEAIREGKGELHI